MKSETRWYILVNSVLLAWLVVLAQLIGGSGSGDQDPIFNLIVFTIVFLTVYRLFLTCITNDGNPTKGLWRSFFVGLLLTSSLSIYIYQGLSIRDEYKAGTIGFGELENWFGALTMYFYVVVVGWFVLSSFTVRFLDSDEGGKSSRLRGWFTSLVTHGMVLFFYFILQFVVGITFMLIFWGR